MFQDWRSQHDGLTMLPFLHIMLHALACELRCTHVYVHTLFRFGFLNLVSEGSDWIARIIVSPSQKNIGRIVLVLFVGPMCFLFTIVRYTQLIKMLSISEIKTREIRTYLFVHYFLA
jgi:hypothetical protein